MVAKLRIQFQCPTCSTTLSVKSNKAGQSIACVKCKATIHVPVFDSETGRQGKSQRDEYSGFSGRHDDSVHPTLKLFFNVGLGSILISALFVFILFGFKLYFLGGVLAAVSILLSILLLKFLYDYIYAKSFAIKNRKSEVDLFLGTTKLVLWEGNEGLLFLKNKRILGTAFGPIDGGGIRFIFPLLGEEIRMRVPLTVQMTEFVDSKVLTKESINLHIRACIWWKVESPIGFEKLYMRVSQEIDRISDGGMRQENKFSRAGGLGTAKRVVKSSEMNAAQMWLMAMVESNIRKIISKTSVAAVISSKAKEYLVRKETDKNTAQLAYTKTDSEEFFASPESLGASLHSFLVPEIETYGIVIDRLEIQEIRLPEDIQKAIDRVWNASLLPAQTEQESVARYMQIKTELEAVRDVIGIDAATADHVLKNFKGSNFVGRFPSSIDALIDNIQPVQRAKLV